MSKSLILFICATICSVQVSFSQSNYDRQRQDREYKRLSEATKRAFTVGESTYKAPTYSSEASKNASNNTSSSTNSSSTYRSTGGQDSQLESFVKTLEKGYYEKIENEKIIARQRKIDANNKYEQEISKQQNIDKDKKYSWLNGQVSVYTSQGLTTNEAYETLELQYYSFNKNNDFAQEKYNKTIASLSKFKEILANGTIDNLLDLIWETKIFPETSTNNLNILKKKFPQNLEYIEKYEFLIMNYYFGAQKPFLEKSNGAIYPPAIVESMTFEDKSKLFNQFNYLANKYPKIALQVAGNCREHLNPFDMIRQRVSDFMSNDKAVQFEAAKNVLLSEYPKMDIDNKDYLYWIEFYKMRLRDTVEWILAIYPDYLNSLTPTDWARIRKAQNTDFYYINIAFRKDPNNFDNKYPALKKAMKGDGFEKAPQSGKGSIFVGIGDYYEGNFENFKINGKGKLIQNNGNIYEGNFVNETYSGQGKITYLSNGSYEGNWENDQPQGLGLRIFKSGNSYSGDWVNGEMQGEGTYTYTSGNVYQGEIKKGEFSGNGIYTFPSGTTYEGQFKNSKFSGKGIMKWKDGASYDGEWLNGEEHGKGLFTKANGKYRKGTFKNGASDKVKYYDHNNNEISAVDHKKN